MQKGIGYRLNIASYAATLFKHFTFVKELLKLAESIQFKVLLQQIEVNLQLERMNIESFQERKKNMRERNLRISKY